VFDSRLSGILFDPFGRQLQVKALIPNSFWSIFWPCPTFITLSSL